MTLERSSSPLDLEGEVFPQRVHVPDDQVGNYPCGERVTGPAVCGNYQASAAGDGLDQGFRVG